MKEENFSFQVSNTSKILFKIGSLKRGVIKLFVLLTFGVAMLLSTSCKKESLKCNSSQMPCVDTTFYFGNTTDLFLTKVFNPAIEVDATSPTKKEEYTIDIDNDGTQDFVLTSRRVYSSGGVNYSYASISSLNTEAEISTMDTFLLAKLCVSDTHHSITNYTHFSSFTCAVNSRDSICDSSAVVYPKIYDLNSKIIYAGNWLSGEMHLSYSDNSSFYYAPNFYYYKVVRGIWNGHQEKYVGVRVNKYNTTKFGWIKLSVDNHKNIKLHEFAIQK